jgi:hypothetical protein
MLPVLALFALHLTLQSEDKTFLRNVGKFSPINAARHPRRPEYYVIYRAIKTSKLCAFSVRITAAYK